MGFENFKLSTVLVPELYGHVLVANTHSSPVKEKDENQAFATLGNNEKRVLLLVNDDKAVFLSEEDLHFLTGILTACKLNLSDVALLNMAAHSTIQYKTLWQQFNPVVMICFGISSKRIGLQQSVSPFETQSTEGVHVLFTPSLQEIASQVEHKKKLWQQLKNIFGI